VKITFRPKINKL